jgi:hypothetical protein
MSCSYLIWGLSWESPGAMFSAGGSSDNKKETRDTTSKRRIDCYTVEYYEDVQKVSSIHSERYPR